LQCSAGKCFGFGVSLFESVRALNECTEKALTVLVLKHFDEQGHAGLDKEHKKEEIGDGIEHHYMSPVTHPISLWAELVQGNRNYKDRP
jgi:hypothetical protein